MTKPVDVKSNPGTDELFANTNQITNGVGPDHKSEVNKLFGPGTLAAPHQSPKVSSAKAGVKV